MARFHGFQKKLCLENSFFLMLLERKLMDELNMVLAKEETLWKHKSRCNWLSIEIRDIFHSTIDRRRRNKV